MTTRTLNHTTDPCIEEGCRAARHVSKSGYQLNRCLPHHRDQQRVYMRNRARALAEVKAAPPAVPSTPLFYGRTRTQTQQIERERMATALIEMTTHIDSMRRVLMYSDLRVTIALTTPGAMIHMAVEGVPDGDK